MSEVIEVTDQNFEDGAANSDLPTEVDFWSPWCGPCRMVSPICDKLSEEYEGEFKFCKLNVDENPQMAMKYQIVSIPMQMFFANGEKADEILGALPEGAIRSKVEDVLKRFPTDERERLKVLLTSWGFPKILGHRNRHVLFLMWVNTHPEIARWNLLEFPCCAILDVMAPSSY